MRGTQRGGPDDRHALRGRRVLVAGATGGIGEGVTRELVRQGAETVAVGRSRARLEELALRLDPQGEAADRLEVVEADVTGPASARGRQQLDRFRGTFDGVFVGIGSPGRPTAGTVLDIPEDTAREMVEVNELGGLRALQALVPVLRPTGALVNVLGYSAEIPFPGNPLMGSTNAAMRSLLLTLAAELRASGPRVYALVVGVVRTRARQAQGLDDARWLTGDQIGAYTADLVTGRVEDPQLPLRYLLDPALGPSTTPLGR